MPNSDHQLFVYGTLAPGRANNSLLEGLNGTWQEAEIYGTLYPAGVGPTLGYPVVDLDRPAGVITGYLFTADNLPEHWRLLDDFEGVGYKRVRTDVRLADGAVVRAFVYALDKKACRQQIP